MATRDKSRKSKKGKAGRRRVVVVRRRRKRPAKRVKRKAGTGVFGSHFPTNRTIDSNQYWQLRAEIAGAESRVVVGKKVVLAHLRDPQNSPIFQ